MSLKKIMVNNADYINYKFTAGYSRLKDTLTNSVDDALTAKELLDRGYQAVFFNHTFNAKSLIVPPNADCMVGFSISKPNVHYKLSYDGFIMLSGISDVYNKPGVFRPPHIPRSDRFSDVEDFKLDPMDNIHIVLENDCIIGRNYLPFLNNSSVCIELSDESDINVYYMIIKDSHHLMKFPHQINLAGTSYRITPGVNATT
jgi:hypothetical protein